MILHSSESAEVVLERATCGDRREKSEVGKPRCGQHACTSSPSPASATQVLQPPQTGCFVRHSRAVEANLSAILTAHRHPHALTSGDYPVTIRAPKFEETACGEVVQRPAQLEWSHSPASNSNRPTPTLARAVVSQLTPARWTDCVITNGDKKIRGGLV